MTIYVLIYIHVQIITPIN